MSARALAADVVIDIVADISVDIVADFTMIGPP